MDPVLAAALAPVLRDLDAAGFRAPRLDASDWTEDPDRPGAICRGRDGSGVGIVVDRGDDVHERVAAAADQVQEWLIEDQLWGERRPTNWPVCPHHPDTHPLRARPVADRPAWVCPTDGTVVADVGSL